MIGPALPEPLRSYLAAPELDPVWAAVRAKLERSGLAVSGTVRLALDEPAADRLSGLLGATIGSGQVRLRLEKLDAALRDSAAAAGLIAVVAALTGPLVDRAAARAHSRASWVAVWAQLDAGLAAAGCAAAGWVPAFLAATRRSGLLTRAGPEAASAAVTTATAALAELTAAGALEPDPATETWVELAELSSRCAGDAHALDEGRLAALLVLRAAAAALAAQTADTPAARRALWARLGVGTDTLSGTVLALGLRPRGGDPWSAMMRARAALGLVTHLTLAELAAAGGPVLAGPGAPVAVCENPQVLQAAARAGLPGTLLCLAGQPSAAGWAVLRMLVTEGAAVRYHGDFDWPGMAIAARVLGIGASPWRLGAADYAAAVAAAPATARLALSGPVVATPWDPALATTMARENVAVHEEALLGVLLADLADSAPRMSPPVAPAHPGPA